jgi:hypothetical protein
MLRVLVDRPITMLADLSLAGREPRTTTPGDLSLRGREPKITTPDRGRLDQALQTTHLRHGAPQDRGQDPQQTMDGQKQPRALELRTISPAADRQHLDPEPRITIPHLDRVRLRKTTARAVVFRVRLLGGRTSRKDGQAT